MTSLGHNDTMTTPSQTTKWFVFTGDTALSSLVLSLFHYVPWLAHFLWSWQRKWWLTTTPYLYYMSHHPLVHINLYKENRVHLDTFFMSKDTWLFILTALINKGLRSLNKLPHSPLSCSAAPAYIKQTYIEQFQNIFPLRGSFHILKGRRPGSKFKWEWGW